MAEFNKVVEKLNILSDMTTINKMWLLLLMFVCFGVFFVIMLAKRETFWQGPTSLCICMLIACVAGGVYSGYCVYKEPTKIVVQVSANTEDVTVEDIARYFDCTEITLNNEKIVCVIEPKYDYFNEDESFWNETNLWLEQTGEKKKMNDWSFWNPRLDI